MGLEQLKDIHLPQPIVWWYPYAPGWIIILALLIMVVIYLIWRHMKFRIIKKQIRALMDLPKEKLPLHMMMTLKAAAIKHSPLVANRLQGEQWTQWLEQQNIQLNDAWQQWLSQGYLDNAHPPKDWVKQLPKWLKKLH